MSVTPIHNNRAPGGPVPLHDLDAERSVIGAMLLSSDAVSAAVEHVTGSDFYRPAHGHIYDAVTRLYTASEPVDAVTVADQLRANGLLDDIGGPAALIDIQSATPSTTNAERYARIVAGHAILRRLSGAGQEIAELGRTPTENPDVALETAETLIYKLGDRRRRAGTAADLHTALGEALTRLEMLHQRGDTITGVPTGYIDLDEQLAGLQPSNLVVVGARPGAGKTSFALGLAVSAAKSGHPTTIFSLEMSRVEITMRLICAEAKVDMTRLRNGRLVDKDWPRISHAMTALRDLPLTIDDNADVTLMEIRAKARRQASRGGLDLIVVDYLQLMTGSSRENRQVEISELSRGLKLVARDLDIPVVALSQLNRTLEHRADKRPVLADLRESGAIEADSDVVLFLYRDELHNSDSTDRGTAEIITAKHRNGPTGTTRLVFIAQYAAFANMARA